MTKVFRINTSNIEGVGSNENNSGRILSKGEAGFYDNNFGKLELVVGDGVNTHLKNKILGKGVFYGGNADSGDGLGYDTIKLIPDATLHFDNANYNNHQYLIIDPTQPNHIHIRAGGAQDASTAELFLGGENTNIKVSDSDDSVTIKTLDVRGETPAGREWVFDNTGKLTLPGGVTVDTDGTLTNGDFNITLKEPMTENTQVFKFTTEPGAGALGFPDGSFQTTAANLDQLEVDGRTILTTVDDAVVVQTSMYPTMTAEAIAGSSLDLLVVDISANDDITVVGAGWEINAGSELAPQWLPVVSTDVVPGDICSIDVPGFEFIAGFTYTFRNTNEDTYQWTFNPNGTLIGPEGSIFSNETSALPKREYFTDKVTNYYWDGVGTLYIATVGDTNSAFLLTEEIETEINQLSPATNTLTLRMTDGDGNSIVGVCSRPTSINNSFSYSQLGDVPGLQFFLDVEWTSSALPAINTLTPLQRFSVDQGTYRDLNIELLEPHGQFEQRLVFRNDGSLEIPEQIQLGNILISSTQNGLTINSSGNIWTFDTNGHLNVPNEIASDQTMLGIRSNTGARLQYQDPTPTTDLGVLNQSLVTVDPTGIKLEIKSSDGEDTIGTVTGWTFNVDGVLTLPAGGDIVDSNGTSVLGGGASTGNFTFNANTASLPLGNTMTLQTFENGGNRESVLTLAPIGDSALDIGGGLRVRTAYGTGFEKSWTFNTDGSITFPDASVQSTAATPFNTSTLVTTAVTALNWAGGQITTTSTFIGSGSATSTSTGVLRVQGGAGISGNLYANTIYSGDGYFRGPAGYGQLVLSNGGDLNLPANITLATGGLIKGPGGSTHIGLLSGTGGAVKFYGTATIASTTSSISTNTGALTVAGGVGIGGNLYAGGNIVTPNRPAFRVTGAGTTNNLTATQNTTGVLNSNNFVVDYNQGGYLNTSTGVFTAPIAGLYQINVIARNSGYGLGISQIAVTKNRTVTDTIQVMVEWASTSTMNHTGGSTVAKLAVGDTLELKVYAGEVNFDTNDNWSVAFLG